MKPLWTPYKNTGRNSGLFPTETQTQSLGSLQIRCTTAGALPVSDAVISVTLPSDPANVIEQLTTDESGLTDIINLPSPPSILSQEPSEEQPYSQYDLLIFAPGYIKSVFAGIEILPDVTAQQNASLSASGSEPAQDEVYIIDANTLYGDYPPKIPEAEIKPTGETGEIVLNNVVIPEYIIVHDGPPASSAKNYYVGFRDYIKNVASSEIYATWPEQTIYANVLAILSFTLNRVYTEWYRNQGYNYTITSTTAYDHKWTRGRNSYANIGLIVDSVFTNYLSFPNIKQPILTQYCDGHKTKCPGWMTQWGSKSLGDQGYTAIQILRNYYGDSMFINTAIGVSGVPVSWPGSELSIGASGGNVRTIQTQLNRISDVYTAIPKIAVDGSYGPKTANAVKIFQKIFQLPQTGIVNKATWYKLSQIYVGVTRMAG